MGLVHKPYLGSAHEVTRKYVIPRKIVGGHGIKDLEFYSHFLFCNSVINYLALRNYLENLRFSANLA